MNDKVGANTRLTDSGRDQPPYHGRGTSTGQGERERRGKSGPGIEDREGEAEHR